MGPGSGGGGTSGAWEGGAWTGPLCESSGPSRGRLWSVPLTCRRTPARVGGGGSVLLSDTNGSEGRHVPNKVQILSPNIQPAVWTRDFTEMQC